MNIDLLEKIYHYFSINPSKKTMKITVLDNVKDSFKPSERQKIIN